jgi:formylglycine-generating enzyme required for sulfatase activity
VRPTVCVSWFQAEQACALSGKRLLTNQEWQRAAAGTVDPGVNNDGLANTMCNTDAAGPRNTGNAGATPGGADSCISNWGVQDMVGNAWELVADWVPRSTTCGSWGAFSDDVQCLAGAATTGAPGALIRGGSWHFRTGAGVFAVDGGDLDLSEGFPDIGFRCAR